MARLLFVYNADSGLYNALLDTGRRIFKPSQYACALCLITYGPFGMKDDWKKFVSMLPYKVDFLHKNELPTELEYLRLDFPCLVLQQAEATKILIDGAEFRMIRDLKTLQTKVTASLQTLS